MAAFPPCIGSEGTLYVSRRDSPCFTSFHCLSCEPWYTNVNTWRACALKETLANQNSCSGVKKGMPQREANRASLSFLSRIPTASGREEMQTPRHVSAIKAVPPTQHVVAKPVQVRKHAGVGFPIPIVVRRHNKLRIRTVNEDYSHVTLELAKSLLDLPLPLSTGRNSHLHIGQSAQFQRNTRLVGEDDDPPSIPTILLQALRHRVVQKGNGVVIPFR